MALIVRDDGTSFVLRAYRERLAITKRSLLVQRIRLLAEQHGEYAVLSQTTSEQYLEIAFSADEGYLFGEVVWRYFGKPRYLIFCERHPQDPSAVLIVVVRDGSIYLDAQIADDDLASELLPLLTSQQPFRIVTVGDVPISQVQQANHFSLPESLVASFEVLVEPLLPRLPMMEGCKLKSLVQVLTSKLLGRQLSWPLMVPVVAVFALLGAWWLYPVQPEQPSFLSKPMSIMSGPYNEFYQGLAAPVPQAQIDELAGMVHNVYLLPGWDARTFNFRGNQYQIVLMRSGGNNDWLNNWARHHYFKLRVTSGGATLKADSNLEKRDKPTTIYPTQQVVSLLADQFEQLLGQGSFMVSNAQQYGGSEQVHATLNLRGVSPSLLNLIGQILGDDLPITIENMQVTQQASGLLSGSIQLSVWGRKS